MKTERVLIVTPFHLSAAGGVTSAVRALHDELTRVGRDVTIMVPFDSDHVMPMEHHNDMHRVGLNLRPPGFGFKSVAAFGIHFLPTLIALKRFLDEERIDVVSIQYPISCRVYFGLLRRFSRWKLVVTYQGNDAHDLPGWRRLDRALIGILLRNADALVAVSGSLADTVCAVIPGLRRERIRIIPNGAAECRSRAPVAADLPAEYIVSVGHLIHRKGMDTLIDALRIAIDRGCASSLVIVGDGPDRSVLVERARAAGLASRVNFVGTRSQEETSAIVQRSRFFVLASRAEGLPLVIVEAMSCRKAIVATNVDGVPDVVLPDGTGLLVPPNDPAALADAILALDSDDALRSRLAAGAHEHFRRGFTWHSIAQRYDELFDIVMSGGSVAAGRDRS